MTQGCIGPRNDASFEGPRILRVDIYHPKNLRITKQFPFPVWQSLYASRKPKKASCKSPIFLVERTSTINASSRKRPSFTKRVQLKKHHHWIIKKSLLSTFRLSYLNHSLVDGFNPSEKYKKCLKPPHSK